MERQQLESEHPGETVWIKADDKHYWTGAAFVRANDAQGILGVRLLDRPAEDHGQGVLFSKQTDASGPLAFRNTDNLTAPQFEQRLDSIIKIAKAGGSNVFRDLKAKGILGLFENPTRKFRLGRLRVKGELDAPMLAEVLAHEVGHQIDSGSSPRVWGDCLSRLTVSA